MLRLSTRLLARSLALPQLQRLISSSSPLLAARERKDKGGKASPSTGGSGSKPVPVSSADGGDEVDDEEPGGGGKDLPSTLSRTVEWARREFSKLRAASATPSMLDHIVVEAYGERSALKDVAQVTLKGPMVLWVSPFDSALAEACAAAIRDADLNLNPIVEGGALRIPVPKTSKETREATVKVISRIAESAKTRVRRARGAALDKIKKAAVGAPEDDVRRDTKAVEEAAAAATLEIAKAAEKKKLEVEAS